MKTYKILLTLAISFFVTGVASAKQGATYKVLVDGAIQEISVVENSSPIVLTGTQVMTIENLDYTIRNNITLRNSAVLYIKNSTFNHVHDYSFQYWLNAYDSSRVVISNSTLKSSPWLNWNFFNYASLQLTDVINADSQIWHGFHDSTKVTVKRTSKFHGTLSGYSAANVLQTPMTFIETVFRQKATVTEKFPLTVGSTQYVFPNSNDYGVKTKLTLKYTGSTYSNWGITYVPTNNITIKGTKGLTVTFNIPSTFSGLKAEFSGLRAGYYADQTWTTGNAKLRLFNTTTNRWSPIVAGSNTLTINDSELADNAFSFGNARIYINRSSLSFIRGNDWVQMYLSDSAISGDVVATGNSMIELKNTTVSGKIVEQDNASIVVAP